MPKPILFDHVPKTGGMALHAMLRSIVGVERCSDIVTGSLSDARAEFDRFDVVSGHLFFHPNSDLSDLWTFTVLRNPLDRIVSHFFYSKYDVGPTGDEFSQLTKSVDFNSFVASDDPRIIALISNTMVAHFAPLCWDGAETLSEERSLQLAKDALERFELVGLTERMNETADLLCWAQGWKPVGQVPRMNSTTRKVGSDDISTDTRTRLLRHNRLDMALYAHARELYDRSRRRAIFAPSAGPADRESVPSASSTASGATVSRADYGTREVELVRVDAYANSGVGAILMSGELVTLRVVFRSHIDVDDLTVGIAIRDARRRLVFATNTRCYGHMLTAKAGSESAVSFNFRADIGPGRYWVGASVHPTDKHLPKCYHWADDITVFDVAGNIGWRFEGLVKLYPTLAFNDVIVQPSPEAGTVAGTQYLARMAPALTDLRQSISLPAPVPVLRTRQLITHPVRVRNTGSEQWPSVGERSVRLSYHWLSLSGEMQVFDGERTLLPSDIDSGQEVGLRACVRTPEIPGSYLLRWSMVQESVCWFDEAGGERLVVRVEVVDDRT